MGERVRTPDESPGFLLWRTTLRWQREMAKALKPHGLTHVQFVLLASVWWLADHEGAPTQRQVAEHAGTDAMMTSQVLRALETRRLIRRAPDQHDARAKRLSPTREGTRLAEHAIHAVEAADREFFTAVDDLAGVTGMLKALADPNQPT